MAAQTIEVPDDAQLTQYGEAIGGSPGFRNRLRAEVGETEVSLMLGRVDPLAAAMLVTRTPSSFAVVRHCTAGGLRSRGFVVRHTPSPTNGLHVSVLAPVIGPAPAVWDDRLASLFDEALAEESPVP
jgi:hypothetical protein